MRWILVLFVGICISGCNRSNLLPFSEPVLTAGMAVRADHPNGPITISAGIDTNRTFSGPDWSKTRYLIARKTRWAGSLGLYDPADSRSASGRLLADEGRLFFQSESEALRYLNEGSNLFKPIYTNSGLVVGYYVSSGAAGEPTRSVRLYQIYIDGRLPTSMRGADDSAITIAGGTIPPTATPNSAPVGLEPILGTHEYQPSKGPPKK